MKKILITRPKIEAEALTDMLTNLNLFPLNEPLLNIQPIDAGKSLFTEALTHMPKAILVTSKRAITILNDWFGPQDIPLFAVGSATAQHAITLGYECKGYCENVGALPDLIMHNYDQGRMLYIRGEHISTDIAAILEKKGFSVDSVIVYCAIAKQSLSKQLIDEITSQNLEGALFFSQRTAATYMSLIKAYGLTDAHQHMQAICISDAVANRLRELPWKAIHFAKQPDMDHVIQCVLEVYTKN